MRNAPSPLSIRYFDTAGQLFAIKGTQLNSDEYLFGGHPTQDAMERAQGQFQARGHAADSRPASRDCGHAEIVLPGF